MDRNADDHDPEVPSGVSPRQLEEALKWLEELTAKQSRLAESGEAPVEPVESPFHGLIESDEGDLPDWLHEARASAAPGDEEIELESRLDWLAKMAQRESIEELPTLEWRHLTEPVQNALRPPVAADFPDEAETSQSSIEHDTALITEASATALVESREPEIALSDATRAGSEAAIETTAEALEAEAEELPAILAGDAPDTPDEAPPAPIVEATEPALEPTAEEHPAVTDLDAAMAWIEELAASQDAPIEDVPSVADRALASKLMQEAGLSPDALDSGALAAGWPLPDLSLLEGKTPTNPFVEAEDFADTIVLVETMADRGAIPGDMVTAAPPADPPVGPPAARAYELPEPVAEAEAASFDDAMAYLEDLAATRPLEEEPLPPAETQAEEPSDALVDLAAKAIAGAVVLGVAATTVLGNGEAEPEASEADIPAIEAAPAEPSPVSLSETEGDGIAPFADDVAPDLSDAAEPAESSPVFLSETEGDGIAPFADDVAPDQSDAAEPAAVAASELVHFEGDSESYDATAIEPDMAGEVPEWMEEPATAIAPTIAAADAVAVDAANGESDVLDAVERRLRALDLLALPPGRTLADIDATLRRSGVTAPHNLPAAIDWLEVALRPAAAPAPAPAPAAAAVDLVEEDMIARMPEDPDAVLAWLEQLAGEEMGEPSEPSGAAQVVADGGVAPRSADEQQPVVDVTEADLLNMPDDPDEVMAWLEGLAGSPSSGPAEAQEQMTDAPEATTAGPIDSVSPEVVATPRSRRRRGRGRQNRPLETEEPEPLPAGGAPAILVPPEEPAGTATAVTATAPVEMAAETDAIAQIADEPQEEAETATEPPQDDALQVALATEEPLVQAAAGEGKAAPESMREVDAPQETPRLAPRMRRVVVRRKGPIATTIEPQANDTPLTTPPAEESPVEESPAWIDLLKPLK